MNENFVSCRHGFVATAPKMEIRFKMDNWIQRVFQCFRFERKKGRPYQTATGRDMENYRDQLEEGYGPITNPFEYYREFVDRLDQMDSLRIVPLGELQTACSCSDHRRLSLRHDVDADVETALRAARHLARVGVAGSFYLLHTAPYYGDFLEGLFVRNPLLPEWVRGFIVAGCELGLHNDAWGVCLQGFDGAAAVCEEIAWLRSHGAAIRGTVGHNSAPAYGAENFEIFGEHVLWKRKEVSPSKMLLAIGSLSEAKLGLTYEGAYATKKKSLKTSAIARFLKNRDGADVRSESWMKRYLLENPCLDWTIDFQIWLLGKDSWVVAGRWENETIFQWDIRLEQVLTCIREFPVSSRSVAVIHPCYVRGQ